MPNMQVLCPYYVKNHMKAMLHWQMCGCIFKIWAQWIDYKTIDKAFILYIFDCYLTLNQNVVVQ